jgi:hypothetical protein
MLALGISIMTFLDIGKTGLLNSDFVVFVILVNLDKLLPELLQFGTLRIGLGSVI